MNNELRNLIRDIVLEVIRAKDEEDRLEMVKPAMNEARYRARQRVLDEFDDRPKTITQIHEGVKEKIRESVATVRRWSAEFLRDGLITPVYNNNTRPKFIRTKKETT